VKELQELVRAFLTPRFKSLYHTILMHRKYSASQLRKTVRSIAAEAEELRSSGLTLVVFIDEAPPIRSPLQSVCLTGICSFLFMYMRLLIF
jgi:hypothetical protein